MQLTYYKGNVPLRVREKICMVDIDCPFVR